MEPHKRSFSIMIGILVIALFLTGCDSLSSGGDSKSLSIVISNPVGDVTVSIGETVGITSTSISEAGISQVQLLVNGQVTASASPQEPGAEMFVALTIWVPTNPGTYQISVAVEDVGNQRVESSKLSVTVQEGGQAQSQTGSDFLPPVTPTNPPTATEAPAGTNPPTATNTSDRSAMPTSTQGRTGGVVQPSPTSERNFVPLPIMFTAVPPSGPRFVQFETKEVAIPPSEKRTIIALCPEGSVVTGGGFSQEGIANNVEQSLMSTNNGWMIVAKNYGDSPNIMHAYAVCLSNSGGTITTEVSQANVHGGSDHSLSVMCPAGSVVTGGGWAADGMYAYESTQWGNGWSLRLNNSQSSPNIASVQVLCLTGTNATTNHYQKFVLIPEESFRYVFAFCGPGELITGGGFSREVQSKYGMPILQAGNYGWAAGANSFYVSAQGLIVDSGVEILKRVEASATCLSFP